MKKKRRKYLKDLIAVDINKLVLYDGSFEYQFDGNTLSLVPENYGKRCFLVVFVNNQRQPMQRDLYERPHVGRLRNGGRVPYHNEYTYYVIGSDGRRYRHLFLDAESNRLGVRTDFYPDHNRAYPRKGSKDEDFRSQCKRMEKELFGEDEWEAFHRRTVLKSRFGP
jgi:hypothetical protein